MNKERIRLISSVLISALVLAILYVGIDYSTGYGQKRASIYSAVSAQWALEDWSHCAMVPFAALLIVFLDRSKLLAIPLRGVNAGLPVFVSGYFSIGSDSRGITFIFPMPLLRSCWRE